MIIETIERLSIDVFVTAMAITAVVIATIALSQQSWNEKKHISKSCD